MDTRSPRQRLIRRWESLKQERQSWETHWKDLAHYIQPYRERFEPEERNKGERADTEIINGKATWSARVLASGMMAGITSPARQWFKLSTPDARLAELGPVKEWLGEVEDRLREAFHRSNIYNALHQVYVDLGTPGTAAMLVEEDTKDTIRAYVFPVGSYALANSDRLAVDTLFREVSFTVGQLVKRFGLEKCCAATRSLYEAHQVDKWVKVLHVIQPADDYQAGKIGPSGMRWKSCWLEVVADDTAGFLKESGFYEFPVMAPRWNVCGEDVYGSPSPGMEALGDTKGLQLLEERKAQIVDKITNPPMVGPPELQNTRASLLPGDTTYLSANGPHNRFQPAHEIHPSAIPAIGGEILRHEERIASAYFADLWLRIAAGGDNPERTAREVAELHEEKMLQLGPVMERLQNELLEPLIDRVFAILLRAGLLPPPPEELQGQPLKVEYLSIMAQAQKLLGKTSIDQLLAMVGSIATVVPDVVDKLNTDQVIDEVANILGTPPELVRTDDEVAAIRQKRAEQRQAQAQAEAATQAVETGKTLAETSMEGDSALNRLVNNLGGVPAAMAGRGGRR